MTKIERKFPLVNISATCRYCKQVVEVQAFNDDKISSVECCHCGGIVLLNPIAKCSSDSGEFRIDLPKDVA